MKIQGGESHVKGSHGLTESKGFRIKASGAAFQMLSSGMYSDKPAAVLREIGCNATDAHIAQGTPDRPIEVKLPNRIDNQFYVKDWGPGLSHDDVMGLYTTYFESTKQTSNDYTGAFGLGSKSPFSYVDSFTVTSVHGGKKRTYTAHLGDDGSPTIALLTTEQAESDWEHGIQVSFPIKPDDYAVFQERAQRIYRWFRVTPRVIGAAPVKAVEWAADTPLYGKIMASDQMRVLMGNVVYPVNVNTMQGLSPLASYAFRFGGIVLKMPIGSVQVAISREELQYDPQSMTALANRLEQFMRVVANELEQKAREFQKADWTGKCSTKATRHTWSDNSLGHVNWSELFDAAGFPDADELAGLLTHYNMKLPAYAGASSHFRVLTPGGNKVHHMAVTAGRAGTGDYIRDADIDLEADTAVYFGAASHPLARARKAVIDGKHKQIVLVSPNVTKDATKKLYEAEAKKFAKEFGIKAVFDVAALDLPAGFAARGSGTKKGKKKGATLPPLPSEQVMFLKDMPSDPHKVPPTADISKIRPADQHFMCRAPGWSWGYDRGIRVFDRHADKDTAFSAKQWNGIWGDFVSLQKDLGAPRTAGFVLVDAAKIRALDLPKRGWKTSYHAIQDWLADPGTRDLVANEAGKWRPTVQLVGHASTWVEYFVWLRHDNALLFNHLAPVLTAAGLHDQLVDIHKASKDAKVAAGQNTPSAVLLYDKLRSTFTDVPPIPKAGARTYLSPADLERQVRARFPMARDVFDVSDMRLVVQNGSTPQVQDFLKLLFS